MTLQYIRKFELLVGDAKEGIDLSAFRCVFHVQQQVVQSPTTCNVRIYNLANDTVNALKGRRLVLSAGYAGQFGAIFDGKIIQKIVGRESPVDTYVDYLAVDGIDAYQFAVVNFTLAAGWTQLDMYKVLLKSMEPFGITEGHTPTFSPQKAPSGRVLYGYTRDYLREMAQQTGCVWGINQGRLDMVPHGYGPQNESAVEVNAATGMVGSPQQTADGINLTVLLNPAIKGGQNGSMIHLNNSVVVNQMKQSGSYQTTDRGGIIGPDGFPVSTFPSIAQDGFYKVYSASHFGDTRGEPWYTQIVATDPKGQFLPRQGPFYQAV